MPNYALLQERRYRRIWRAYREIIRHIDEQDECWRWQHRLWADFCRLATQVALLSADKFQVVAESPLRIATEQQRGRWAQVDAHSGVFLLHDEQGKPAAVLSFLWDTKAEHQKLAPWMAGLGAAAVLHLQNLTDGRESYLLLWPLHLFGDEIPDLHQIAESGRRALERCLSELELADNVNIRAEGLVLVSNFDTGQEPAGPRFYRAETVLAAQLSAGYDGVHTDIEHLGDWLYSIALRLVEGAEAE